MDKNDKILLSVVVVVITVFCLTAGVLSASTNNKPAQSAVTDTPIVTNTQTNEDTDNSNVNKVEETMTAEQAMQIVNNELSPYYKATSAILASGSPNPVYIVHIIHTDPEHSDYGQDGGTVTVDTITKFVDHKGI